jgi:hypothetical protein
VDQAKSAHEQAVNGYTREEREAAPANVGKCRDQGRATDHRSDGGLRGGDGLSDDRANPAF